MIATSQFVGSFLLGAVASPFGWVTPMPRDLPLFAASGMISVCGLLCLSRSLKLAPASNVVPYQYSQILWALVFGLIFFGDVPSSATLVGAAIITRVSTYFCENEGCAASSGRSALSRNEIGGEISTRRSAHVRARPSSLGEKLGSAGNGLAGRSDNNDIVLLEPGRTAQLTEFCPQRSGSSIRIRCSGVEAVASSSPDVRATTRARSGFSELSVSHKLGAVLRSSRRRARTRAPGVIIDGSR